MKTLLRYLPVLAVAVLLAGCEGPCSKISSINAPKLTGGSADFSVIAAVGTSISAGYESSGLVNRHQVHAFPALFAAQTGHTVASDGTGAFTFNAVSNDGIGATPPTYTLLEIKSLSPLAIDNVGRTPGAPMNMSQATDYHNLAVPGELAVDLVDSTYYTQDPNPIRGSGYNKTFFNLIYRSRGLGVMQLARRAPTFITYEFGANEVLGAATSGTANVFPVGNYVASVQAALNTIHALLPNAKVAVFNVPDVTSIPYCTTFPPVTISLTTGTPISLIGPGSTALSPTALVLLTAKDSLAAGTGFPLDGYNYLNPAVPGNGRPLLDSQVLDDAEQTTINNTIFAMNSALDAFVADSSWMTEVDLNGLLSDLSTNGFQLGSTTYTTDFVTGGLFSLDGVHPTDLEHAIVCNKLIDAVNAKWGSTIPHLVVSDYATPTSSRLKPVADGGLRQLRIDGLAQGLQAIYPYGR